MLCSILQLCELRYNHAACKAHPHPTSTTVQVAVCPHNNMMKRSNEARAKRNLKRQQQHAAHNDDVNERRQHHAAHNDDVNKMAPSWNAFEQNSKIDDSYRVVDIYVHETNNIIYYTKFI